MNARTELVLTNDEPRTESNALMALIERAATSSDIDVDKLDKLLSVKERWDAQQAKRDFDRAMAQFSANAPTISRNAQGHNSKYAKLDQTLRQIQDVMRDCGLSHRWRPHQTEHQVTITCIVSHVGGHSEESSLSSAPDTSGGKNSIQAIGSAISYLERYTLFAALGLASGEGDDDGHSVDAGPPVTQEQAARLRDELEATGGDEKAFCRWFQVSKLEEVPATRFDIALKDIQNAGKARKGK